MGRLRALLLVVMAACGGGAAQPVDAGPRDGATPDAFAPDAFSCASCADPVGVCDEVGHRCAQCATGAECAAVPHAGVCADGACVECADDGDCTGGAFGPTCDTAAGYCRCAGPADCAGNPNGATCDETLGACTCTGDGDCATGTCQPQPYLGPGARTCQ